MNCERERATFFWDMFVKPRARLLRTITTFIKELTSNSHAFLAETLFRTNAVALVLASWCKK